MGKDGVAAPQARSVTRAPRPPSSVQRSCLTETAGLALCPLRSGGSTWLLPARGFFIGCGAGFMAAVWHLTNACPRLLCPYPQHRCDVGVAQLPPQLPTLRGHFAKSRYCHSVFHSFPYVTRRTDMKPVGRSDEKVVRRPASGPNLLPSDWAFFGPSPDRRTSSPDASRRYRPI